MRMVPEVTDSLHVAPCGKKQNAVLSAMGLISLTSFLLRLIAKFKDRKIFDTG